MQLLRTASAIAILSAVFGSSAASEPRIVDIRVGQHAGWDRIVVELEQLVPVHWSAGDASDELVFEFGAQPLLNDQILATGRKRVGELRLEATRFGARLRVSARPRRARAFSLLAPPRLVIDLADPSPAAFTAPAGVQPLRPGEGTSPFDAPPAGAAPVEALELEEPASQLLPPAPLTHPQTLSSAESAESADEVEEILAEVIRGLTEENADVAASEPVAVGVRPWLLSRALLVPVLMGAGLLMLAAGGLALTGIRQRRPALALAGGPEVSAEVAEAEPAVTEPSAGPDRLQLLERRLDAETGARHELEQRLAQASRELVVLRERLKRLASAAGNG
jgi:hypothetical protein